jgi:hypothetical protein
MEFRDALYSRRSVHSFTGRIVTKSKIHSMPIPIGEQDEPVTPKTGKPIEVAVTHIKK